jgi:hypothetical protein
MDKLEIVRGQDCKHYEAWRVRSETATTVVYRCASCHVHNPKHDEIEVKK